MDNNNNADANNNNGNDNGNGFNGFTLSDLLSSDSSSDEDSEDENSNVPPSPFPCPPLLQSLPGKVQLDEIAKKNMPDSLTTKNDVEDEIEKVDWILRLLHELRHDWEQASSNKYVSNVYQEMRTWGLCNGAALIRMIDMMKTKKRHLFIRLAHLEAYEMTSVFNKHEMGDNDKDNNGGGASGAGLEC